ncbi:MAG: hypothetical protein AB8H03_08390 [Saprospiraceae bacterium]
MKKYFQLFTLFAMIFCFIPDADAFVVDVKSRSEKVESNDFSKSFNKKNLSKKQLRKLKRHQRKIKRMEKRLSKFQKKWEKRAAKKNLKKGKKRRRFFGGVTDDNRFRIGVLLIIGSIVIGILARVPLFGGLFGILSGLCGLVGLVLVILAFIAYYQ